MGSSTPQRCTKGFRARARDSLEKHGGLDSAAFNKLCGLLRCVDGDYNDPATYQLIRKELGSARRPAHYPAIPPVLLDQPDTWGPGEVDRRVSPSDGWH